jgi:hypothetical protein
VSIHGKASKAIVFIYFHIARIFNDGSPIRFYLRLTGQRADQKGNIEK